MPTTSSPCILPTAFSKDICYAILPSVFDRLLSTCNSIVVVITPLTAIINVQVSFSIIGRCMVKPCCSSPNAKKTNPSLRVFHFVNVCARGIRTEQTL